MNSELEGATEARYLRDSVPILPNIGLAKTVRHWMGTLYGLHSTRVQATE
ncbi:hypothetical protein SCOR_12825 [Sulfidibacter corallicola]